MFEAENDGSTDDGEDGQETRRMQAGMVAEGLGDGPLLAALGVAAAAVSTVWLKLRRRSR